jgi:hypothetical protein
MAHLEITDGNLVIDIRGLDQLLALRSSISVPLSSIKSVTARPPDARGQGNIKAYRVAGALIGSTIAGYFWVSEGLGASPGPVLAKLEQARDALEAWPDAAHDEALEHVRQAEAVVRAAAERSGQDATDPGRGWAFFMVTDPDKAIGIDVEHGRIRRVVVEVDDETPEAAVERIRAALSRR